MKNNIINLVKILYPEYYATKYIYTYPLFNSELRELIEKSGYVKEFKVKYYKSLRFLENLKKKCIMQPKVFEQLINTDGIYSMILKGRKNIRILFDFQIVKEEEIAILYYCFEERTKKDYLEKIDIVKKRRKELFYN